MFLPSEEQYMNNDEYRFKGFEVTLTKALAKAGQVRMGYSYLDAEDRSDGSPVDDLEYRPEHKFVIAGSYSFDVGLTAYASPIALIFLGLNAALLERVWLLVAGTLAAGASG